MFRPFEIIWKLKPVFFVWALVQLFFGQVGILGPLLFTTYSKKTVWGVIEANLAAGNFYTFSIALLAGAVALVTTEICLDPELSTKFRSYKVCSGILAAVLGFACAFLFSGLSLQAVETQINDCSSNPIDWTQLACYGASIVISVYIMCVMHLHLYPESFQELEDQAVGVIKAKSKKITADKKKEVRV